ncbi:MAG: tetratricopeptide repeat protein [Pirellulaceae bacterium]
MATATPQAAPDTHDAPPPSLVARLLSPLAALRPLRQWALEHRLAAAGIGGSGLLGLLLILAAVWYMLSAMQGEEEKLTLAMALEAYDVQDFARAREIAEKLSGDRSAAYEQLGGPPFILGAITAQDAELEVDPRKQRHLFLVASRYLEEANKYGFPPDRKAEGLFMLGQAFFRSEQYAPSILVLREALDLNPHRAAQLQGMLARAYARDLPPQNEKALTHLAEQLADPQLSTADQQAALLETARIQLAQNDLKSMRASLDGVPDGSPLRSEKLALIGQLLLREGETLAESDDPDSAREKYTAAVKSLRLAEGADTSRNQTSPKAEYLLGVAYRRLGELSAAERQFERTAKLRDGTPEGVAAALEAAEVKQLLGKHDEAAAAYRITLEQVGRPTSYRNPWAPLDSLRERLEAAYKQFLDDLRFADAVEIAKLLPPLISRDDSAQLEAEAYHAWGESLLGLSAEASRDEAAALAADGYARFRSAGRVYARLATMRKATRDYPDELWNSATNFLQGHDFRRAIVMLSTYLETVSNTRRPHALTALGEAYLTLDETDKALPPLEECIRRFANHPAVYQARLLAARVQQQRGDTAKQALEYLAKAKSLLEDNLHHEALTPRSVEWRDSLFELGRVLYQEGMLLEEEARQQGLDSSNPESARKGLEMLQASDRAFQAAAEKLTEAATRYPDSPQAIEARYLMAEGHRHAAEYAGRRRAQAAIEATRVALEQEELAELAEAAEGFAALVEQLNRESDRRELNDIESGVLRNAYFGKADALFKQDRFDEALTAYSAAADRFHDRPEVVEALVQMSRCQRELGEWELARGALERARATIERLADDTDFTQTTRHDRDGWLRLLDWLITLYSNKQSKA